MKRIKEFINMIYTLAIFAVFLFMIYLMIKYTGFLIIKGFEKITHITSNTNNLVIVAIITGGISIVTALITSVIAKIIEYRQITKRYLYEKREKPYSEFIAMVYKLQMSNKKNNNKYSEQELVNDITNFSKSLTLWGSSKVIQKWNKFREFINDPNETVKNLILLEDIVFEIRKDMGQKKKGLHSGDLLSFFINDIKNHINKM